MATPLSQIAFLAILILGTARYLHKGIQELARWKTQVDLGHRAPLDHGLVDAVNCHPREVASYRLRPEAVPMRSLKSRKGRNHQEFDAHLVRMEGSKLKTSMRSLSKFDLNT